jgi:hypothetical protein
MRRNKMEYRRESARLSVFSVPRMKGVDSRQLALPCVCCRIAGNRLEWLRRGAVQRLEGMLFTQFHGMEFHDWWLTYN